jgi:hypothetical protein
MATRWYPSENQLGSPADVQKALKQVLDLHYGLEDQQNTLAKRIPEVPQHTATSTPNPPSTTSLLGLPVGPVDTTKLADGTKLTYVAAQRMFVFK